MFGESTGSSLSIGPVVCLCLATHELLFYTRAAGDEVMNADELARHRLDAN